MDTTKWGPGGVISEIVDKVSFANFLPLLTRATAENDEPTAGYMFKEIEKITFQLPPHCQQLAEYLNRRLEKPSACVKLKVLKIMLYLIQSGHISFRYYLRRNDGYVKLATMYNGPPDPLLGATPYENVRRTAQELLDELFNPDMIHQDDTLGDVSQSDDKDKLQLGGLGSTGNNKGKYEGFGSTPNEKEETIKDKMIDMLEKLIHPTDETAEMIRSALTNSPGDYEPVAVDPLIASNMDTRIPTTQKTAIKMKAHVPGRAGGGWESDEDVQQEDVPEMQKSSSTDSGSTVSVDSLEKIDPSVPDTSPAKEAVNEFCRKQKWPISLSELHDACQKCATMNCGDILQAVGSILQSRVNTSDISLTRALLMLEWYVRTDFITPAAFSQIVTVPLQEVLKSESVGQDVKVKAQKIKLILEKLQVSNVQPS